MMLTSLLLGEHFSKITKKIVSFCLASYKNAKPYVVLFNSALLYMVWMQV